MLGVEINTLKYRPLNQLQLCPSAPLAVLHLSQRYPTHHKNISSQHSGREEMIWLKDGRIDLMINWSYFTSLWNKFTPFYMFSIATAAALRRYSLIFFKQTFTHPGSRLAYCRWHPAIQSFTFMGTHVDSKTAQLQSLNTLNNPILKTHFSSGDIKKPVLHTGADRLLHPGSVCVFPCEGNTWYKIFFKGGEKRCGH